MSEKLPVESVLDELADKLKERDEAILQAPPGAGKTTLVPLKFLESCRGKILILEPRRIAARNAAARMADLLGEKVGQTVGYRMRLDTKVGARTRIEVITEGVFIRMLQDDPSLSGVDLVIFDEFHERSLDADFGLSLTLQARELFRDTPLKLLLMSATLNQASLQKFLPNAAVVQSEGKSYPVDIHYTPAKNPRERLVDGVQQLTQHALKQHPDSSILVFLPGEGEIRQLESRLKESAPANTNITALFGNLSLEDQLRAIKPSPTGTRKVVLATNIAETSLTIEGIHVVVDSGLERRSRFDPNTAMSRLQTEKISQASATQRSGRAGRLGPGHCYRYWSKEQQQQLAADAKAEILEADLGDLALQILSFGLDSIIDLSWLDPPPSAHWQQAMEQLTSYGAVQQNNQAVTLTSHGSQMAKLGLEPRLSHMLVTAKALEAEAIGCGLAALYSERDPLGRDEEFGIDLEAKLSVLLDQRQCPDRYKNWLERCQRLISQYQSQLSRIDVQVQFHSLDEREQIAVLVAAAYPDRIARKRHGGAYQLANGRSAKFPELPIPQNISRAKWVAASEVTGNSSGSDTIRGAIDFESGLFESELAYLTHTKRVVDWDKKSSRFVAENQVRVGQLVLKREPLKNLDSSERVSTICTYIAQEGLVIFKHYEKLQTLQKRCAIAYAVNHEPEFDLTDQFLLRTLDDWLGPYLIQQTKLENIRKLPVDQYCFDRLSFDQQKRLSQLAPKTLEVPSGSNIQINYQDSPPVLAVKLQEMFGCDTTPTIAEGTLPLQIHLLSPAGRPLQITQDLHGFWRSGYGDVRKDMRGRYPKHPWPEDPTTAEPTRRTKRSS